MVGASAGPHSAAYLDRRADVPGTLAGAPAALGPACPSPARKLAPPSLQIPMSCFPAARGHRLSGGGGNRACRGSTLVERQLDGESATGAFVALDRNGAAVLLDDQLQAGQPDTGARDRAHVAPPAEALENV